MNTMLGVKIFHRPAVLFARLQCRSALRAPAARLHGSVRRLSTTSQAAPPPPRTSPAVSDPWDPHPPVDAEESYSPPPYKPEPRVNESLDTKRTRLVWHSRKRGILETDLLLSTFAARHLRDLSPAQLDAYDALLSENDWDIYYWATRKRPVPEHIDADVMRMIQEVADNQGRKILRMPELNEFK